MITGKDREMNINNIDDFIKFTHPAPKEGDPDYNFYKQWGYEYHLIRKYKYDLEGLRVLMRGDYNMYKLAMLIEDYEVLEKAFIGKPIIKTKKIVHRFLKHSLPKGFLGILVDDADGLFCIFPNNSWMGQMVDVFSEEEIEITDQIFSTEKELIDQIDNSKVACYTDLKERVVYMPEYGNVYVATARGNDCYHGSFGMEYSSATLNEKSGKWKYLKSKKDLTRVYSIDYNKLEDVRILQ